MVQSSVSLPALPLSRLELDDAASRWKRFEPLLKKLFSDLRDGRIDSPFFRLPEELQRLFAGGPLDSVWVKSDHDLPVTGCIKARGGFYEVLTYAEELVLAAGILTGGESYEKMASLRSRTFFGDHTVAVGSTGNLGYSVGVMARALGFRVEVHMSHDAKSWKKTRLRDIGAVVVEHPGDYSTAVAAARNSFAGREKSHFIDDENSTTLFLGYATAAFDLQTQLEAAKVMVTIEHPLYVYLPCGVGGAPGGVTFGLKTLYGDAVHCVFVEPTASPCMLVQLAAGLDNDISVYDIGLDNRTIADGLAVSAASKLVAGIADTLIDGVVTVSDKTLYELVQLLWEKGGLKLEPSAASGFAAVIPFSHASERTMQQAATHVVWTTGGAQMPEAEFASLLAAR